MTTLPALPAWALDLGLQPHPEGGWFVPGFDFADFELGGSAPS